MNKTMLDSALFRKFGIVGLTQYAYSVCKKIILFALSEKLTKDSLPRKMSKILILGLCVKKLTMKTAIYIYIKPFT
jgi:hypothetical protein